MTESTTQIEEQPALKEVWARWRRSDGRCYAATIQKDLFGNWSIIALWGSESDPRKGGQSIHPVATREDAQAYMDALHRTRIAHDYQPY